MEKPTLPARLAAQATQLRTVNERYSRFGLTLSEEQVHSLLVAEAETLRAHGRLEFGEGVLPRLIEAFCDSPLINREEYCDTLDALQTLFYAYQADLNDVLSDEELVEAMHVIFHGRAQGALEYMENLDPNRLLCALRSDDVETEDEDD